MLPRALRAMVVRAGPERAAAGDSEGDLERFGGHGLKCSWEPRSLTATELSCVAVA